MAASLLPNSRTRRETRRLDDMALCFRSLICGLAAVQGHSSQIQPMGFGWHVAGSSAQDQAMCGIGLEHVQIRCVQLCREWGQAHAQDRAICRVGLACGWIWHTGLG